MNFVYTPQDAVARIYPWRGFTSGNEKVKAFTSYFFDKSNAKASCKFAVVDAATGSVLAEHTVNVIEYDDEGVVCFHPPAYLFKQDDLFDL